MIQMRYSMFIQWSDDDQAYIVSLPEWEATGMLGHTHGATYEEAAQAGQEMLALLLESRQAEGLPQPEPRVYAASN